jgi:hypothetical protein
VALVALALAAVVVEQEIKQGHLVVVTVVAELL